MRSLITVARASSVLLLPHPTQPIGGRCFPAMLWRSASSHPKAIATREGESVELPGGITSRDLWFTVPLRWTGSGSGAASSSKDTIEVFARELVLTSAKEDKTRPHLLFLQGGPGFPSPRVSGASGWVGRALKEFRVVLLDQRGTGRSTPVTFASMAKLGSPEAVAERLRHFRGPEIVRDCEAIRRVVTGGRKWTVLGQSYGGFCLLTYLSFFPEAIAAGLFTGGLPPLPQHRSLEDIYRATYARVAARNGRFYERYPGDVAKVKTLVSYLRDNDVTLPSGGRLTPRRFLQLGLGLGGGGYFETLHYLVSEAMEDGVPSYSFLRQVDAQQPFDTNPIYALLHEAIYCQGNTASNWAALRVLESDDKVRQAFDWEAALSDPDGRIFFTAEMIFPSMFEDYAKLRGLGAAAQLLAEYDAWSPLYDEAALKNCQVPCAALVYNDDAYVERDFSEETAALLPKCRVWVTNQYQHSGLRDDGVTVLENLLGMTRGTVDIPS